MNVATGIIPLGRDDRFITPDKNGHDRETVYSSDLLAQGAILVEKALDSFSQFHEAVKV
jgi:hypothetical protein